MQAIRASETLYKAGDRSFAADYQAVARDTSPDVVMQALLTMNILGVAETKAVAQAIQAANKARGVQEVTKFLRLRPRSVTPDGRPISASDGTGRHDLQGTLLPNATAQMAQPAVGRAAGGRDDGATHHRLACRVIVTT
jgi:hypothetical protein